MRDCEIKRLDEAGLKLSKTVYTIYTEAVIIDDKRTEFYIRKNVKAVVENMNS